MKKRFTTNLGDGGLFLKKTHVFVKSRLLLLLLMTSISKCVKFAITLLVLVSIVIYRKENDKIHFILNRPFKHNYFDCVVIVLHSLFKVEPYQWFVRTIVRTE